MKSRNHFKKYHITFTMMILCTVMISILWSAEPVDKKAPENIRLFAGTSAGVNAATTPKSNKIGLLGLYNDPFFDTQWYIENQGQYADFSEVMMKNVSSTEDVDMDVTEAWQAMADRNSEKREVIVAVIDTGVDYTHPDLARDMWMNTNEIPGDNLDNDNNGYVDDVFGWDFFHNDSTVCHYEYSERYSKYLASPQDNDNHGTHIAGIIAAMANNNTGIAGIASNINIKIMSLKISGGDKGDGSVPNAIEAIKYATMMGADICNLSWGTTEYSAELEEVMRESDMLFVAAAGNRGDNNDDKPVYPASFDLDNLISVTFIDADGEMNSYSNYGPTSVDLAAPGYNIYSTIVGSYATMSGTSMAAPQVSGVAALLYSCNDHLYAADVKNIITGNIKEINGLEKNMIYGGIPDAYKAVLAAEQLKQDSQVPTINLDTIYDKENIIIPVESDDSNGSGVRVIKWMYGAKALEDFAHGTIGTSVTDKEVDVSKAGTYTFYISDYAGNEIAQTYEVVGDTSPPKLTTTFVVSSDYKSRTVTVNAEDDQSGIKRVEYLPGIKKAKDFLPADTGTAVEVNNGKWRFKVKKDGIYTVFATDYRGNVSIKPIVIKTVKAKKLQLFYSSNTISVGEKLILRANVEPLGSTDRVVYASSNRKVATVSATGKILALARGRTYITATTPSGLAFQCLIKVQPRAS